MEEIWKDLSNYEGIYKISNLGKIKTIERKIIMKNGRYKTIKTKIMKTRTNNRGYHIISLTNSSGIKKDYLLHRLVAKEFLENPNNLPQINHIDGNKNNNAISNLEWCDQSYNMKESYRLGLRKTTLPEWTEERKIKMSKINKGKQNKSQMKKVARLDKEGNIIDIFNCASDACKILGYKDKSNIYDCCNHRKGRKTYMGYKWKYID